MENRYWQTVFMTANTDSKRPPQWLALHFPQALEQACLQRLAGWCYQYSSQVCIAWEHSALLLEVAASQRLFGDAETLAKRIHAELEQLGYPTVSGIAPTPEAAHLAARHGLHIHTSGDIRKSIGALGVEGLNLHTASIQALQKMGF